MQILAQSTAEGNLAESIFYVTKSKAYMQTRTNLYIDGRWAAPSGTKTIDVISPSTEQVIGSIPEGNVQDVQSAVSAAKTAFGAWSSTTAQERITYLQKIHEGIKARADELAQTIASEVGMPLKMSSRV